MAFSDARDASAAPHARDMASRAHSLGEVTLVEFMSLLLRHRRLFLALPLAVFVLVIGFTFTRPRSYTATASFVPQSQRTQTSGLMGLAAQFGVNVPGGDPTQSPDFYADLVTSPQLLRSLVDSGYVMTTDGHEVRTTLPALFKAAGETPAVRREATVRALADRIGVSRDIKTGVVAIRVKTRWPALSAEIATRLVDLVNRFNLETRQEQAQQERQFLEGRIAEARASLRRGEDGLQRFMQDNREYRTSPQLSFTYDRLEREITMRQEVYTTLMQSYEQARLESVRNTPAISIVERPIVPPMPDRRHLLFRGVLALIIGTLAALAIVLIRESFALSRVRAPDEADRFLALLRESRRSFFRRPSRSAKRPTDL